LSVRDPGHFEIQGIGGIDDENFRDILPALEPVRARRADPPGLGSKFAQQFKDVIEGVAVVGKQGVGNVGPSVFLGLGLLAKERVIVGGCLVNPDSQAEMALGSPIAIVCAARDGATKMHRRDILRAFEENLDLAVPGRGNVPRNLDIEAADRQVTGDALEAWAVDHRE
jgi:hypothetical protein